MVCGAEAVLEAAMSSVVRESAIVFMLGWGGVSGTIKVLDDCLI